MSHSPEIRPNLKKKRRKELFAYFREVAARDGLFAAVRRTLKYLRRRHGSRKGRFLPSAAELESQRAANTEGWPLISILVPVFNVPRPFFEELLRSVLGQSYPNWELCLASTGDERAWLDEVLAAADDKRVKCGYYENEGIAANTNRAAGMASGQYIAFADHDDVLSPDAMFELARCAARTGAGLIYSDEALFDTDIADPAAGHFKPDYAPQYLLNVNYFGHMVAVRREVFDKVGMLCGELDGSQDYDFVLRALEETGGAEHIRRVLYYWRRHEGSTSADPGAKPYAEDAARKAVALRLEREGIRGEVQSGLFPSTCKVNYEIKGRPLVSIIIPSSEHVPDLDRCIRSLYNKTQYRPFELLVVENHSKTVDTFNYYEKLVRTYPDCRVLIFEGEEGFNFSRVCNFGRDAAIGQYLLFLNNDTEVITPSWIDEMLQLCQLEGVGAVGAMLYYPDDTVQHAGVITGLGGYAGHSHKYAARGKSGYMFRQACVQELSAVTGACMMVKRDAFDEAGGFDPGFAVAYNDVDLCLRLRAHGYSVIFTPYAELYHYESKSRGPDEDGEAAERFTAEKQKLLERYGDELRSDPYYSPWLTGDREDFTESDVVPV